MLRIFSIIFCMFISFSAFAETVRLSWNPPTLRENGEKIQLSEIAYYVLRVDGGAEEVIKSDNVIKDLSAGSHSYSVYVCDVNGMCSIKTDKVFVVKSRPKKPKYPSVGVTQ